MSKRAEYRRQAKEQKRISMSPIAAPTVESVAKATGQPVFKLLEWQKMQRESMDTEIRKECQKMLWNAEVLIQGGMMAAAVMAVRKTWKNPLNLEKYFENLNGVIDEYFTDGGMEKNLPKLQKDLKNIGFEFEYDNVEINREFHFGDYDWRDDIDECTPGQAYEHGWNRASVLCNIINTVLFARHMLEMGYTTDKIQQVITSCNRLASEMHDGKRKVSDEIINLRKFGIDIGEENLKIVKKYNL